ncbi:MAG: alpha/beta hydrolase [Hyphomicrobiales bacterium]|nr:alpha/beta hydrolase [Hyphomicrobiales bacterium]
MQTFEVGGLKVAYIDEGSGPPVIFAHCSSASHRMWRPLIEKLKSRHRIIAPDLIGYGATDRWPEGKPFEFSADSQILVELAKMAGEPAHFVGHSYGGAVSLQAVMQMEAEPRGMTLYEPVAFPILPATGRQKVFNRMVDFVSKIEAAAARGDHEEVARLYMGFWIGRLRWWLTPRKLKDRVLETVDKVAMEFGAIRDAEQPDLDKARKLSASVLMAYGAKTRPIAIDVIKALNEVLPNSRIVRLAGASHMGPMTHPDKVNAIIEAHIAECLEASAHGAKHETVEA